MRSSILWLNFWFCSSSIFFTFSLYSLRLSPLKLRDFLRSSMSFLAPASKSSSFAVRTLRFARVFFNVFYGYFDDVQFVQPVENSIKLFPNSSYLVESLHDFVFVITSTVVVQSHFRRHRLFSFKACRRSISTFSYETRSKFGHVLLTKIVEKRRVSSVLFTPPSLDPIPHNLSCTTYLAERFTSSLLGIKSLQKYIFFEPKK